MKSLLVFFFGMTLRFGYAHPGIGIVQDSKSNIYYTDLSRVWKINDRGIKIVVVPDVHTHELYLDENDNLYGEHLWYNGEATNTWGHYVWKLSPRGEFEKVIPDKEGFLENYSFVRDHFGRMYWADRKNKCQHVVRKNTDNTIAPVSDDCFGDIRWMHAGKNGRLYVVDKGDLKEINANGKTRTAGKDPGERKLSQFYVNDQHAVYGVWDDKQGNIYTAIYSARVVKRFSPQGKEEVVAETSIPWSPTSGLVDAQGNLWLLECSVTNSVRVEKIAINGTRKVF